MPQPLSCHLCGKPLPAHAYYIVNIEVFADPSMPPLNTDDLEPHDFSQGLNALMAELNQYTNDELQDLIHRRFKYHLCPGCQRKFIANPLGLPRAEEPGQN